jgi:hypothetical protein
MPLVIHPRVRKGLARLAAATTIGMLASTGVAAAATGATPSTHNRCATQSLSQPFASLGDNNQYFLLPGGNFDNATDAGWHFIGASVSSDGAPLNLGGSNDTTSLTIPAPGVAISPTFCLDSSMPDFRFMVRQVAPGSDLKVYLHLDSGAHDLLGQRVDTIVSLGDGSSSTWTLTDPLALASALRIPKGQSAQAQLVFAAVGRQGSWQIDDVYVDPWSFG